MKNYGRTSYRDAFLMDASKKTDRDKQTNRLDRQIKSSLKEVQRNIHVKIICDTVDDFGPNGVRGIAPPLIHPSESSLPRLTRAVFSQLRSGFFARLKDFQHRIGAPILLISGTKQ